MAQKLKFLGVPVYMNGQNYFIPSLSFPDFKKNYDFLVSVPDIEGPKLLEYFDALVPIIMLAVNRNYPELTVDEVTPWLDMTTLPLLTKAVQAASGLVPVTEGE